VAEERRLALVVPERVNMRLLTALRARLFGESAASQAAPPAGADASTARATRDPGGESRKRAEPAETDQADAATIASRQERAESRLLDDERLRGNLTDDQFQPLLDWALSEADRIAASTAGLDDEAADRRLDAGIAVVKEVVQLAGEAVAAHVEAAGDRRRGLLAELASRIREIGPAGGDAEPARRRIEAVARRLGRKRDLDGAEAAAAIAEALRPAASAASGPSGERAG
jgi:hypothetical protein